MGTCHFIFWGCHFLLNLNNSEELKYLESSLTLSSQSIILSDYKWKDLGHSNVLFSNEETLKYADETFDMRRRGHSPLEKQNQEYKIVNIWWEYMVEKTVFFRKYILHFSFPLLLLYKLPPLLFKCHPYLSDCMVLDI